MTLTRRTFLAPTAAILLAAGLLVVSPARPLFPVETLLDKIRSASSPAMARVWEVYSVYHARNAAFAPVLEVLPPDVKVLGAVTSDDPETSLWHPYGARRVEHVLSQDTAADLKARGIEYILVKPDVLKAWSNITPDDWFRRMNATVVQKFPLNLRAAAGTGL